MQIQISSRDLLRSLNAVSKVINSKNAMPILGSVLFSQSANTQHPSPNTYSLTASDGENELTCDINLVVLEGTFRPFCVEPKLLMSTLPTLGDQPLTLTVTQTGDNVKIDVRYLNGQFSVPGYVATEYKRIVPADTEMCHFVVSSPLLLGDIASAAQCTATDELRPQMASVCLDITSTDKESPMPDRLVVVGSDGRSLYKHVTEQCDDLVFKKIDGKAVLLVSRSIVSTITNAFKGTENVEVVAMGRVVTPAGSSTPVSTIHNIIFRAAGIELIARAIEGKYPNYNSVIPTQHSYKAVFNVKSLQQSFKRIMPFASDASQLIALRRKGFETILSSEDIDFSTSASETIDCQDCTLPDGYAIGMKSTTALQHLGIITTDNVRFELSDANRAIIIREDDAKSTLTLLLMPMLIQE